MVLRILHNFIFYFIALSSFIVGYLVAHLIALFRMKDKAMIFQAASRLWSRFLYLLSGVKVTVSGIENIRPGQPYVLVANHQGIADIPILLAHLPVIFNFAIKKSLFNIPIFGDGIYQAGHIPVDREAVAAAHKTINSMLNILRSGGSILVFPEGTRSRDGSLGKFKGGFLMVASRSGAPVVPIAISGSYNILPRGERLFRPAEVKLSIGKAIYIKSEHEGEKKIQEVREAIARML
jgi:1-acyl-sn-glycerol-3-phosphate acyltransferase